MSLQTHTLLTLVDAHKNGLKSMLTHYIDATVDSQFASFRNSFETMIQSGVIGPNCDGTHFGMTLPQPTHTNTHQSSDECSHEYSNDTLTTEQRHQNNLQNEVSNTINTDQMIKQEFDEKEEDDGEEIDDENVVKCEKCENGICTSGDDAEMGENGDECSDTTQLNKHSSSENNQITQSIISNDLSPSLSPTNPINTQLLIKQESLQGSSITLIPLDFTGRNVALNDISIDGQIELQNRQIETDEFNDNYNLVDDDYDEDSEEYLNNPNCEDFANEVCDLDHSNSNVSVGDDDETDIETNLDEAQFDINISVTNNTQMNNQNDEENANTEKCVSERNMEQSTPSTSGVRSSTRKRIQTKVFDDLVQSNGNTHNSGKRKSDQVIESVKKVKPENVLNNDEDTDSDNNDDQYDHSTNSIGEDSIATECTTSPIQSNLAQSNRHLHCSHCHKSFDRNSNLQAHLRVHTGERPFQCDLCDKQFNHKTTLKNHLLVHSGERPHQCRFCDKSFSGIEARTKHEQAIHLHVKPYRCKQCGHTATQQSSIIRHIRVVHFGLPQTITKQRELNIIDDRDPRKLLEKV